MPTRFERGETIGSRAFERDDGTVRLTIHAPAPWAEPAVDASPDDPPWRCDFSIDFPDGERCDRYAVGIDGIQALLLALRSSEQALVFRCDGTPDRRPPIRWLGDGDLGLRLPASPTLR